MRGAGGLAMVIWQYWETVGEKPAFIDGLHAIARCNAGVEIVLVTPDNVRDHLPDISPAILEIPVIAHKADMIRALLLKRHGGMWLDSDAVVLRSLAGILDMLADYEFVCFNIVEALVPRGPPVRVCCFASRPGGIVVSEWARQQAAILPRKVFEWAELGSLMLHPICVAHPTGMKVLPFDLISPIRWQHVEKFAAYDIDATAILRDSLAVMLSNNSLKEKVPELFGLTIEQIAAGDYLLSAIMRQAMTTAGLTPPAPTGGA